jgi:hypothetical protein
VSRLPQSRLKALLILMSSLELLSAPTTHSRLFLW